ncbi:MAG TPA: vanadium-dependent haloperoxidase, partial [Polyangiaceae bacterium]|nr:vanadium-dependent haloperoxidase [Polyangiaceae bacterium]
GSSGGPSGSSGTGGGANTPSAVTQWNDITFEAIAAQNPGFQSHTLAMVHLAVHDALNAIDKKYAPYRYTGSAPGASVEAAVAAAAHDTLVQRAAPAAAVVEEKYTAALAAVAAGPAKDAGVAAGKAAAAAILAAHGTDDLGGAAMAPYTPGTPGPGVYQPTPPLNISILVGWGGLPPFALTSGSQFRSPAPLAVTSPEYATDYNEVKDVGAVNSTTRTAEQSETGNFWYDAANREWHMAARKGLDDVAADEWRRARLLALVSVAIMDGSISSFETKYNFNFWRPITAVQAGDTDGNPATAGDAAWQPFCATPPWPDHNSTHAVAAAAASTVLAAELGDDHTFVVTSPTLQGKTRTFAKFSVAAEEMAVSRIYCGIHFRNAMVQGIAQGKQIADYAFNNLLRPVN